MVAQLRILQGSGVGRTLTLDGDESVIGRSNCDIVIDDHLMSRRQTRIVRVGTQVELHDLDSRNGTFVNGSRVSSARLHNGDKILIGRTLLEFLQGEPIEAQPTLAATPDLEDPFSGAITLNAREGDVLPADLDEQDLQVLQRAQSDLAALYRVGQIVTSILETEKLCPQILDVVLQEIPQTDVCSILLLHEETGDLDCKALRTRETAAAGGSTPFSSSIVRALLRERKAVLTFDAQQDGRFDGEGSIANYHIRSAMCVPLQSRSRLLGVVQAHTIIDEHRYTIEDLKLLTAIGMQAGTALENAFLYEKLAAEKASLHQAHEQLKAAQEGLIQSERLAAIGRLTAGIVHDVRNPMTVILGRAQIMQMAMEGSGIRELDGLDMIESVEHIQQGVEHCNHVINQLLQFARHSAPTVALVSINELLEATASFVSHEVDKAGAQISTRLQRDLPPVALDPNQIKQVFLNILINAVEALREDGHIEITTTAAALANGADAVAVHVADNGQGMTPEVKKRLFEPFFTTKEADSGHGGTGLGLSVSYGIVRSHGGTIEVNSTPGEGSTFVVVLPLTPEDASQQAEEGE